MNIAELIIDIINLKTKKIPLSNKATTKIYDICVKLYIKKGQTGVEDFLLQIGWEDYAFCEPCEAREPIDKHGGYCMVCGSGA
jgi:hypothetical protein